MPSNFSVNARVCAARKLLSALATALAISGCALQPAAVPSTSVLQVNRGSVRAEYSVAGRFSAKHGNQQVSGQFRYVQSLKGGTSAPLRLSRHLSLFSPLGTPLAEIGADPDSATLTLANGQVQTAASLTELLRTVIDLPVTDAMLSTWLQGLPFDSEILAAVSTERDSSGAPSRFVESGWEIVISAHTEGSFIAPKRMRWSLLGQSDTEVRWVMDEWGTQ